jgi:hypothetical protein
VRRIPSAGKTSRFCPAQSKPRPRERHLHNSKRRQGATVFRASQALQASALRR